jgi:ABC-type multidrug transport system permease subunit
LVFVAGYALVVAIISTGIGFIIKSVYRKRIWKPGEIIQQKGKIPSLLLMGAIFVFMVYFVLIISGVMYRLAGPGTPVYP